MAHAELCCHLRCARFALRSAVLVDIVLFAHDARRHGYTFCFFRARRRKLARRHWLGRGLGRDLYPQGIRRV